MTYVVTFYPSTARKRIIIVQGRNNSTFTAITQEDPDEYLVRSYNETQRWINETKEVKKQLQRHARGI